MVEDREPRTQARPTLSGFELTRPAEPEAVTVLRHRAAAFAAESGADPATVDDAALAVSEAVSNAVKYAYPASKAGTVELSAAVQDGWLELRVIDRGDGFGAGSSDGLGLGLAIIARLSDDLKIVQEGAGTQVLMRFALLG
ncbi:MAG: ATP-binding protein [Solirubrobacterales bacterium]